VIGVKIGGVQYWYVKNLQGDIVEIRDNNGVLKAKYEYDAFGKCDVVTNVGGIAELNPIRYRSYYYDSDVDLYYLQSRWYDPEVGRFLSPDAIEIIEITKNHVNGLNLYMFCGNDPVNNIDDDGYFFHKIGNWFYRTVIQPIGTAVGWVTNNIVQPVVGWVDNNIISPINNSNCCQLRS